MPGGLPKGTESFTDPAVSDPSGWSEICHPHFRLPSNSTSGRRARKVLKGRFQSRATTRQAGNDRYFDRTQKPRHGCFLHEGVIRLLRQIALPPQVHFGKRIAPIFVQQELDVAHHKTNPSTHALPERRAQPRGRLRPEAFNTSLSQSPIIPRQDHITYA